MKTSLYHYCSIETFKAILEYKTLRLSDITKSNDTKEVKFLFEEYVKWSLKQFPNMTENELCVNSYKWTFTNQLQNSCVFASCLSKKKDDLYMWNAYGDNGKGVFIEFDRDEIEKHLKNIGIGINKEIKNKHPDIKVSEALICLKDVNYLSKNEIDDFFNSRNITPIGDFGAFNCFNEILEFCFFTKESKFAIEEETRIVYYHISSVDDRCSTKLINNLSLINEDGEILKTIKFKSVSTEEFPHKMVLDIPIETSMIKSITIGPNCKLTNQDIAQLLFINEIDLKDIFYSDCSLR